jgi:hypothetical protein
MQSHLPQLALASELLLQLHVCKQQVQLELSLLQDVVLHQLVL